MDPNSTHKPAAPLREDFYVDYIGRNGGGPIMPPIGTPAHPRMPLNTMVPPPAYNMVPPSGPPPPQRPPPQMQMPPPAFDPNMYPRAHQPVPLRDDFYRDFIGQPAPPAMFPPQGNQLAASPDPGLSAEARAQPPTSSKPPPSIDAGSVADKIMRENRSFVEQEVLRQIAANATNVTSPQYQDLIPLSFDEEDLLQKEEARRQAMRDRAAARIKSAR